MTQKKIAFLLSRQSRKLSPSTWWPQAVEAAIKWAVQKNYILISSKGLLSFDFTKWAYIKNGGKTIEIPFPKKKSELHQRDLFMIQQADLCLAIAIRKDGFMEKASLEAIQRGKPFYVLPPPSKSKSFQGNRRLLEKGAKEISFPNLSKRIKAKTRTRLGEHWIPKKTPENFLWHYTRSFNGPWPGQTKESYFESLLQNDPTSEHLAEDTLLRILAEEKIRGGGKLIRQGLPVVCFTEIPPPKIQSLHEWRPGLIRWNFEPYAIGIRKTILQNSGTSRVLYLHPAAYKNLKPSEQFLFQRTELPKIDWQGEKEWRCEGDVSLAQFSPDDFGVFLKDKFHQKITQ